jgi:hypothetical protein
LGVRHPTALDAALANSIHVAIRLKIRRVFLRAARLASDECENVQNRSYTANVPSGAVKALFHPRMIIRQVFNSFAHTPQPVNFQQKVPESRSHDQSFDF